MVCGVILPRLRTQQPPYCYATPNSTSVLAPLSNDSHQRSTSFKLPNYTAPLPHLPSGSAHPQPTVRVHLHHFLSTNIPIPHTHPPHTGSNAAIAHPYTGEAVEPLLIPHHPTIVHLGRYKSPILFNNIIHKHPPFLSTNMYEGTILHIHTQPYIQYIRRGGRTLPFLGETLQP